MVGIGTEEPLSPENDEPESEADYQRLYDAVHNLTEQRREIITAFYGLFVQPMTSIEEIAEQRQLKLATVKNYLWWAKVSLAKQLGPYVMEKGLSRE